jgi:hypothetical protein
MATAPRINESDDCRPPIPHTDRHIAAVEFNILWPKFDAAIAVMSTSALHPTAEAFIERLAGAARVLVP